ncbi:ribonucleases P/MRP protein subunit POP1-domain-containing protein [Limtongia smithiae]|uniref:ribonucleases P/MRP protein subunit POP1-domain-containing protein n=1 Tax=Limtongia smithiae TaxID=1125753 RepID=UPI0034CFAD03
MPDQAQNSDVARSSSNAVNKKRSAPAEFSIDAAAAIASREAAKRAKTANARTILSQSGEESLSHGMLYISRFVNAREFEVKELTSSMKKSKAIQKQQTFQIVPRTLRRRAASHHVKLLPPRFRARAAEEMRDNPTPPASKTHRRNTRIYLRRATAAKLRVLARSKKAYHYHRKHRMGPIGINKLVVRPIRGLKFKKRQKNKDWLPTHLWHAKRAHMITKWGYAIPNHPNDKCYRPTHRQSQNGSGVVFDTSYFCTMILQGQKNSVIRVLNAITRAKAGGAQYTAEHRAYEGPIFYSTWPKAPMCPGEPEPKAYEDRMLGDAVIYFDVLSPNATEEESNVRRALIRVHPSIFMTVWEMLLDLSSKARLLENDQSLEVQDCRYAIGSIDVFGPKVLRIVGTVLRGFSDLALAKAWTVARRTGNPKQMLHGIVFPMNFFDPRTITVKTRNRQYWNNFDTLNPNVKQDRLLAEMVHSGALKQPSALFTQKGRDAKVEHNTVARRRLKKRRSRSEIKTHERKQFQIVFEDDIPIPSLVIRRKNGALSILLPYQWVSIFYRKMVIEGCTIFGGLEQYHQIMSERMLPYFPNDFPGTAPGLAEAKELADAAEKDWSKRPKSKRFNYASLQLRNGDKRGELGNPFGCDWEYLLKNTSEQTRASTKPAQAPSEEEQGTDENDTAASSTIAEAQVVDDDPWMIPNFAAALKDKGNLSKGDKLAKALFQVKLYLVGKGAPARNARVYSIPQNDRLRWMKLKQNRKIGPDSPEYPRCPTRENLIGFVTSGGFNLIEGKGSGIASFSWDKLEQSVGFAYRYCVVRDVGEKFGRLAFYKPL